MQNAKLPKPPYLGPRTVLGLCSPLLQLAEIEAEGKAKAPRLAAQQRGRVAKGKKGRLRAALRHLWGKTRQIKNDWIFQEDCYLSSRSHSRSKVHRTAPARRPERGGEFGGVVPKMPPKEKKG
jgi:hypothetical protein